MEEAQNRITAKARELRAEALKLLACLAQPNVQWEIARHGMFASWIAGGIAIALGAGYVASSGSYWPAAKWAAIGVYVAWMAAGSILLILGWVLSGFAEEDMPKEPWAALIWSGIRGLVTWAAFWLLADSAGELCWGWSSAAPLSWPVRLSAGLLTFLVCLGLGVALTLLLDIWLAEVRQGRRSALGGEPSDHPSAAGGAGWLAPQD